jgi:hypothetical protein
VVAAVGILQMEHREVLVAVLVAMQVRQVGLVLQIKVLQVAIHQLAQDQAVVVALLQQAAMVLEVMVETVVQGLHHQLQGHLLPEQAVAAVVHLMPQVAQVVLVVGVTAAIHTQALLALAQSILEVEVVVLEILLLSRLPLVAQVVQA